LKLKHLLRSKNAKDLATLGIKDTESWSNPPSKLLHARCSPGGTYSPWLADNAFLETFKKVQQHTLVDIYRCYELWDLARQVKTIEGDILEVGVWRGGTGAIIATALANTQKLIYLADTFTGVVKAGENDPRYKGGEHSDTSLQTVESLLLELGLSAQTRLLQGIFPEDTSGSIPGKLAMVHCDVDVYESCKDVTEWCLPRLSVGGVLVFDDYGFSGCEGVTEYCNELRAHDSLRFVYNLNGHAIFIRVI
jgi:O-methyltransferase